MNATCILRDSQIQPSMITVANTLPSRVTAQKLCVCSWIISNHPITPIGDDRYTHLCELQPREKILERKRKTYQGILHREMQKELVDHIRDQSPDRKRGVSSRC